MRTKRKSSVLENQSKRFIQLMPSRVRTFLITAVLSMLVISPAFAHCDSYDGPVVKDALQALETNNVALVYKWISTEQEAEISALFTKTYNLKKGDKEIYSLVEKHFLETLIRLHRQTEGFGFDGIKAAGTTKPIVQLSDKAIETGNVENLINQLNGHIAKVVEDKYNAVKELEKVKNESPEKGRDYVKAYVMYTHSLEAIHDIVEQVASGHAEHGH
ncbi:DUF6448 family protein [Macellibacteroides fermentans]|uniref:DUF6448 family protein n=1 Tax=Macellibacteroides fermentans TaxID=879969 RepID=UPI002B3FCCA7|nr:DUF6448 family protein [Macellibacteroides fermentans]